MDLKKIVLPALTLAGIGFLAVVIKAATDKPSPKNIGAVKKGREILPN